VEPALNTILRAPATSTNRRGVLLLVVLSMLTLFLMLGTTYLIVATRARATARAFAKASAEAASPVGAIEGQRLVDEAFRIVARGPANGFAADIIAGDDLLGDKYGISAAVTGKLSTTVSGSTVITCSVTGLSPAPANAYELAGRVLTFSLPQMGSVSTRILRVTTSGNVTNVLIPAGDTASGESLTAQRINAALQANTDSGPHFVINGREFAADPANPAGLKNEPWDGFDSDNAFLAQLTRDETSSPPAVKVVRSSYLLNMAPPQTQTTPPKWVDNDGDGLFDSQWIDVGFPLLYDDAGTAYKPKAAILVVDLDGRVNVNAHGSGVDFDTFDPNLGADCYPTLKWLDPDPTKNTRVPLYTLPRGIGAGPADVSLTRSGIFRTGVNATNTRTLQVAANGRLLGGAVSGFSGSDAVTQRVTPKIGGSGNAEGRYGEAVWTETTAANAPAVNILPRAGVTGVNDAINLESDRWRMALDANNAAGNPFTFGGRSRGPTDIKGRMKVWINEFGQPVYYKPYWRQGDRGTYSDDDVVDDPYEVNIGRSGSRSGSLHSDNGRSKTPDNLYTAAELEGVLRFFDNDAVRLPRRLVAALNADASSARAAVTTESWDTPAVDGKVWSTVVSGTCGPILASSAPHDYLPPETIMGHRFDINRPFHDAPNYTEPNDSTGLHRRQLFAKQLFCLMTGIFVANTGGNPSPQQARELAQWAVNVVDFRDGDSIMTPFDYDEMFVPDVASWNPTKRVWGAERPELLITEVHAWHDRRTEDLETPSKKVVDSDPTQADDDFDQKRRPRGAFFVELFSPWGAEAYKYDGSGGFNRNNDGAGNVYAGEPIPSELCTGNTAGLRGATVDLSKAVGNGINASPVWRLASVRGDVKDGTGFGTDPVREATTNTTHSMMDPSQQTGTAQYDRVFYFTEPSTTLKGQFANGGVFWQSAAGGGNPGPSTFIIAGTPSASYQPTLAASGLANAPVTRGFDKPYPASLSEPTTSNLNADPYDLIRQTRDPGLTFTAPAAGNNYIGSWDTAIDGPFDGDTSRPAGVSSAFLDPVTNKPMLMANGTHENFAILHLQRLADPTRAWDVTSNPYLTVDALTVDLTVVNTAADGLTNYDEPGETPTGGNPLDYLMAQKQYRNESVQRGGRVSDNAAPADIWSRLVRATKTDLQDADAFRTGDVGDRAANAIVRPIMASPHLSPSNVPNLTSRFGGRPDRCRDPKEYAWLMWANRPFNSIIELALIPTASPFHLTGRHSVKSTAVTKSSFLHLPGFFDPPTTAISPWDAVTGTGLYGGTKPTILDFVHVPSPFGGIYASAANPQANAALTSIGLDVYPQNHVSHFREPGRINVNTIADKRVWRALFGELAAKGDSAQGTSLPFNMEFPGSNQFDLRDPLPNWPDWTTDWLTPSGSSVAVPVKSLIDFYRRMPDPGAYTPATRSVGFLDNHTKSPEATEDIDHDGKLAADEDTNGNGMLDPGEDQNGNGRLDPGEDKNGNGVPDIDDLNNNGHLDPGDDYRNTDRHAYFRYQTMNRLANLTTGRSNVFAVWVTIGFFEWDTVNNAFVAPSKELGIDTAETDRYRGFYIFDRSIPVGYETGKDYNLRDAVILRRVIQ
jgi:hypothetical protein